MNKLLVTTALVASTFASTSIASDLRNVFFGANGGRRVIESTVTEGNVTTFTVVTHKANGNQVTRTFTATATDGGFDISGNGKEGFKDFLSQHAAEAQAIEVEVSEYTLNNQLAFEAWQAERVATLTASGSIFVDSFARMEYNPNVNWIEVTEENGIAVNYGEEALFEQVNFIDAWQNHSAQVGENPHTVGSNTVVRDSVTTCTAGFDKIICDAPHQANHSFAINKDLFTSAMNNEDGTYTVTAMARPSIHSNWDYWAITSLDYSEEVTITFDTNYRSRLTLDALIAHSEGVTGEGIKIGVSDVTRDTESRGGDLAWANSYVKHGTHSQKIVEAFAPGAEIEVFNKESTWNGETQQSANIFSLDGGDKYDIINVSHGGSYSRGTIDALSEYFTQQNLKDDLLFTIAAGNDGTDCLSWTACNGQAVIVAEDRPETTIVVGALADNGTELMGYSQKAGMLKNNFLSTSAIPYTDDYWSQGTSFAAPVVAGAAALVMDKFGTNAAETVDILFNTADDLGVPGVDDVFGHGALNIQAALSPIGSLN